MKHIHQPWAITTLNRSSVLSSRHVGACLVPLSLLAVAPGCVDDIPCAATKTCPSPEAGAGGEAGGLGAGSHAGATGANDQGGAPGDDGSEGGDQATGGREQQASSGTVNQDDEEPTGGRPHQATGGTSEVGSEQAGSANDGAATSTGGTGGSTATAQGGSPAQAGSDNDNPATSGGTHAGQAGESGGTNASQAGANGSGGSAEGGATSSACTLKNDVRCNPETGIPQLCSDELTWEDQPRCQYVCIDGFCGGECTPDKKRCETGSGIPQLCNDAGEWENQGACAAGAACAAGECVCTVAGKTVCDGTCVDLKTDGENCGACGHSCLGGECSEGKCQPVEVADVSGLGGRIALDSTYAYWKDSNSIWRVRKTDNSVQRVVYDSERVISGDLAVHDGYIYWGCAAEDSYSIFRAEANGNNEVPFTTTQRAVGTVLVLDDTLYWAEYAHSEGTTVFSMPIAGETAPDTFASVADSFSAFTMADGCVYYEYYMTQAEKLMRTCGGNAEVVYSAPDRLELTTPYDSSDGTYLYFGSRYEGVVRVSLTGAPSADLLAEGTRVRNVVVDKNTVYYTSGDFGAADSDCVDSSWGMYSIPKTGGTPTELLASVECPTGLAVDSEAVYWVNGGHALLMKLAK